jgi:hypothetical protein
MNASRSQHRRMEPLSASWCRRVGKVRVCSRWPEGNPVTPFHPTLTICIASGSRVSIDRFDSRDLRFLERPLGVTYPRSAVLPHAGAERAYPVPDLRHSTHAVAALATRLPRSPTEEQSRMRGLGDFQRSPMKNYDPSVTEFFRSLVTKAARQSAPAHQGRSAGI